MDWYTYKGSYLNLRLAALLIFTAITLSVTGFILLEDYSLREAFFMTIITISTVGYSEVRPLSEAGEFFASLMIVFNFGVVAYVVAVFSSLVIEGKLFKDIHLRTIESNINRMKDHIIVCGYGRYGSEIVDHLLEESIPFVVIERDNDKIEEIQKSDKKILYIQDDATQDESLVKAKIDKARALVTTFPDDSDNLFTVFSARQINPKLQIISAAREVRTEKKIRRAGADYVMMPDKLGGYYMATLISKPRAREFFSYITHEGQSNVEFDEISFDEIPGKLRGKSVRDLGWRETTGANIIGLKQTNGTLEINPSPDAIIKESENFVVLGTRKQLSTLRRLLAD